MKLRKLGVNYSNTVHLDRLAGYMNPPSGSNTQHIGDVSIHQEATRDETNSCDYGSASSYGQSDRGRLALCVCGVEIKRQFSLQMFELLELQGTIKSTEGSDSDVKDTAVDKLNALPFQFITQCPKLSSLYSTLGKSDLQLYPDGWFKRIDLETIRESLLSYLEDRLVAYQRVMLALVPTDIRDQESKVSVSHIPLYYKHSSEAGRSRRRREYAHKDKAMGVTRVRQTERPPLYNTRSLAETGYVGTTIEANMTSSVISGEVDSICTAGDWISSDIPQANVEYSLENARNVDAFDVFNTISGVDDENDDEAGSQSSYSAGEEEYVL